MQTGFPICLFCFSSGRMDRQREDFFIKFVKTTKTSAMKKIILLLTVFILNSSFFISNSFAGKSAPDTVTTGIYITSIHNIDFKQKEYAITLWAWFKYKNKDFDFAKNLEIPQAKSFTMMDTTTDSTKDGRVYLLMKLECLMKDSWKISKFPFDFQTLRLTMENSQFDSTDLVFKVDTLGEHYGNFAISGWNIEKDSFMMYTRNQPYQTAFGDETYPKPYSSYSAFRVKIGINREAQWTLFWKIFLGMYVAFLIAFVCFFIHSESIESRFGLNVGALFAAVGNKYIIDSSLPDTSSTTLVDTLHGFTLVFIFIVIAATIYSLQLVKEKELTRAARFDKATALVLFVIYVALNIFYISKANM